MSIPKKVRDAVQERSGGICEGCGIRRATDMHHRKYRSRGGKHTPSNLVHLCGGESGLSGGNHSGCHGRAHGPNPPQGWSLPSGRCDPAEELFLHHWGLIYLKD
ncbi:HNH endonuclease [Microbacterium aurugineum]|uniref:HNH endonuclease n=1 Tax=Microbacterium aurugineum TaxID=2851642 RepID=UPI0024A67434|nr:HNH endonuclease [Microbacterium aurugineum]